MQRFTVDLSAATSWSDFVAAFNEGFIRHIGGEWNGNLDAFHDYLWWPDQHPYQLCIRGWSHCSHAVNTHRAPDGRPVLEVIEEIFQDNPQTQIEFE